MVDEPLPEELTRWLERASDGERDAWEQVLPQVYGELRQLASRYAGRDAEALTVPPTAIVHEAWAKLSSRDDVDWPNAGGGITRVDVREDESGCDTVWESDEQVTSVVPKLSLGSGLVYFYTFETQADGENAWYLTALDFDSGETVFKILTGAGRDFDNNWAPITLAPDGTAYVGTSRGIVAIWDQP